MLHWGPLGCELSPGEATGLGALRDLLDDLRTRLAGRRGLSEMRGDELGAHGDPGRRDAVEAARA